MLDRTTAGPTDRIMTIVRALLAKRGIHHPVGRDDDLTASGLSSLDIVNLMLTVEGEFDVKIPDQDMTPANFRTVARIELLLDRLAVEV